MMADADMDGLDGADEEYNLQVPLESAWDSAKIPDENA